MAIGHFRALMRHFCATFYLPSRPLKPISLKSVHRMRDESPRIANHL
jgi:hypothetical protein